MPHFLLNNATRAVPGSPPNRHALAFHRRLPGYAPTPLHKMPTLAARLGLGEVWIKDESLRMDLQPSLS